MSLKVIISDEVCAVRPGEVPVGTFFLCGTERRYLWARLDGGFVCFNGSEGPRVDTDVDLDHDSFAAYAPVDVEIRVTGNLL